MKKLSSTYCMLLLCFTIVKAQTIQKVILENNKIKVTAYDSAPGSGICGVGKHSHPAHLTILLTDANITVTTADGKVTTKKMAAGTTFWSEAETHTVLNSGDKPVKAYLIETK